MYTYAVHCCYRSECCTRAAELMELSRIRGLGSRPSEIAELDNLLSLAVKAGL